MSLNLTSLSLRELQDLEKQLQRAENGEGTAIQKLGLLNTVLNNAFHKHKKYSQLPEPTSPPIPLSARRAAFGIRLSKLNDPHESRRADQTELQKFLKAQQQYRLQVQKYHSKIYKAPKFDATFDCYW